MSRYTDQYMQLQKQLHAAGGYGVSGYKHADRILDLAKKLGTKEILDYGCGSQTLQKAIPFPITNYDPFISGLDAEPMPHPIVVCSDVLEHIEPDCLDDVLGHLHSKTGTILFGDVACRPAKKVLADGRNAHLIIETPLWWLSRLAPYFNPENFVTYDGGFCGIWTPVGKK